MSEEQFKIWKQVEAKGLEKLEKVEKALASTEKEGFEEAHGETMYGKVCSVEM